MWEDFFPAKLVVIIVDCDILGDGLASRLEETADPRTSGALLLLLGCPLGADSDFLAETLKLRYCWVPFAGKLPTWSPPMKGTASSHSILSHVGVLVAMNMAASSVSGGAGCPLVIEELEVLGQIELWRRWRYLENWCWVKLEDSSSNSEDISQGKCMLVCV